MKSKPYVGVAGFMSGDEIMAAIDFPFSDDALKVMSEQLSTNPNLQATQDHGRPFGDDSFMGVHFRSVRPLSS